MNTEKKSLSNSEKMKRWREEKIKKKRAADKKHYEQNRERKIAKVKESRDRTKGRLQKVTTRATHKSQQNKNSKSRARKQKQEENLEAERRRNKIRQQTRERVQRLREKRRGEMRKDAGNSGDESTCLVTSAFKNRMAKTRAVRKTVEVLPQTPAKKAELFQAISSSPRTRNILVQKGLMKTPEEVEEVTSLRALAADISESMQNIKTSKSKDDKAAYSAFKSLAFGKNVSKSKARKSLSKLVNVGRRSVSTGIRERAKILSGEKKSWLDLERKTRGDAISTEHKQLIFNFWSHEASRPTGDKKDVIRKRTGKKQHIEHAKHVLEKTQTEAFVEFQAQYPEVKIKQRKFESLKPFFVRPAREKDRRSCLCRKHVETQIVFKDCMKFRKAVCRRNGFDAVVPSTLTEVVNLTLCLKPEGHSHQSKMPYQRMQ